MDKRMIAIFLALVVLPFVSAKVIDTNDKVHFSCNNATSGALLGTSASVTVWDSTHAQKHNGLPAYNYATGKFLFQPNLTRADTYDMDIDCPAEAVDFTIPLIVNQEWATNGNVTTILSDTNAILADTGTTGVVLATGSVTAAVIATGAIDADAIATAAIDADAIATDAIGAAEIAANAIGASEIATDAIGSAELAADSITSSEIADNSIDAGAIAASAITASEAPNLDAAISTRSTLVATDNIGINWADITNQGAVVDLSATSINLADTCTDVTNGVTVTTNNDKTGYTCDAFSGTASSSISALALESTASAIGVDVNTSLVNQGLIQANFTDIATLGNSAWITATGFSTHAAADIWSVATRALTILDEDSTTIDLDASYVGGVTVFDEDTTTIDIDATTIGTASVCSALTTNNDKTGYALSTAGIDSIWDETISGHLTPGTVGYNVSKIGTASASISASDVANIATAVNNKSIQCTTMNSDSLGCTVYSIETYTR